MQDEPRSGLASTLNASCQCITVDRGRLDGALLQEAEGMGLSQLVASHPHLFSETAVFVDRDVAQAMQDVVAAVERAVALPGYQSLVLGSAHANASVETQARGAFLGFDFHLSDDGPKLIEINSNAGGGLLNAILRRAQHACCEPVAQSFGVGAEDSYDFFQMFLEEWQRARGDAPLGRIAIVDDEPEKQYLYPEFVLFRKLSERHGVPAVICAAKELTLVDDKLCHAGLPIDLVYNRLTDFSLSEPAHAALTEAYRRNLAVVTPHPRAYALYADKRRLSLLCDEGALRELGVDAADAALLARHVPETRVVCPELREELWRDRKRLFFKPQTGYGAKAAYRGDGITKRAFEQVLAHPYVAQEIVPPSARTLLVGEEARDLKLDVRNFAYGGRVQLVCARLYHGQTTNFRSAGGGFAPVYVV